MKSGALANSVNASAIPHSNAGLGLLAARNFEKSQDPGRYFLHYIKSIILNSAISIKYMESYRVHCGAHP